MTLRRLACRVMDRHPASVLMLGTVGMVGFVMSFAAVAAGMLSALGYVCAAGASLYAYGIALTVGHLGDAYRAPQARQRAGDKARSVSAPSSSTALADPEQLVDVAGQ